MKNPFLAPVRVNRELHKSGGRSCMHIELEIEGSKMRYDTGMSTYFLNLFQFIISKNSQITSDCCSACDLILLSEIVTANKL